MIYLNYKLLKKIEKRPAMFIGDNKVKTLSIYLNGYNQALEDYNLTDDFNFADPFHDWVADKLGFKKSAAGWASMILAKIIGLDPKNTEWENLDQNISTEQHERSIRKFYELLEEFVKDEKIKMKYRKK